MVAPRDAWLWHSFSHLADGEEENVATRSWCQSVKTKGRNWFIGCSISTETHTDTNRRKFTHIHPQTIRGRQDNDGNMSIAFMVFLAPLIAYLSCFVSTCPCSLLSSKRAFRVSRSLHDIDDHVRLYVCTVSIGCTYAWVRRQRAGM